MNNSKSENVKRRDFIQLTLGWCSMSFAILSSLAAAARFTIPNVLYEPDRRYKAQKPDEYAEGTTFLPDLRVFLLRKGNSFRAVTAVCSHLGCTVNRIEKGFHCPCHGSVFDGSGNVSSGPAPKPLLWYHLSLSRDGYVVIDTTQPVGPDRYLVV